MNQAQLAGSKAKPAWLILYPMRIEFGDLNAIDHSTQEEEGQEEIREKGSTGAVVSVEDKVNKA
jgi:hypothetical protein